MFDSGISAKDLIAEVKSEVDVALPIPNASYVTWLNSLEQFLYSSIIREQNAVIAPKPHNGIVKLLDLPKSPNEAPIRFEDIYTVYADTNQLIKTNAASGQIFSNCYYKYNNNMAYSVAKTPERLKIVYYIKPALKEVDSHDEIIISNTNTAYEVVRLYGDEYEVYRDFNYHKDDTFLAVNSTAESQNHIYISDEVKFNFTQAIPIGASAVCKVTKDCIRGIDQKDGEIEVVSFITEDNSYNVMLPIEFIELAKSKLRAEAYMIENEYTPAANWLNNYNVLLENFKQWLSERTAQFGM